MGRMKQRLTRREAELCAAIDRLLDLMVLEDHVRRGMAGGLYPFYCSEVDDAPNDARGLVEAMRAGRK